MFVPFNNLPDHARVWVYQADRFIGADQRLVLEKELLEFTSAWSAHGHTLASSFAILEDYFVILAVDELINNASGCSIDQSTQIIKKLEQQTGIDFCNRSLVPFEINGRVQHFSIPELKKKFASGELNKDSVTFNILVDTIESLRHHWRIPASKSWVKRYIGPLAFDSING